MAEDQELYPYEVISDVPVRHNHEDHPKGSKIEVTKAAALANRWLLKPLSPEGEFPPVSAVPRAVDGDAIRRLRAHQQIELLEKHRDGLQKELDSVNKRIEALQSKAEEEVSERKARQAPPQENVKKETKAKAEESKG